DLLEFIEKHLKKYFNQDEHVPLSYQLLSIDKFQNSIKHIKKKFAGIPADKELLQRIITTVNSFVRSQVNMTYRQFTYTKEILEELEILDLNENKPSYFSPLTELMFYMNFNCSLYTNSLINDLVHKLNQLEGQREKILFLCCYQKELNQLATKPGMRFRNNPVSLKEQLNEWIEEEIIYLEKANALFSLPPVNSDVPVKEEEKICFSVPVTVLALLGRSACDAKLVLNKNKKKAMSTIARLSKTVGSADPQGHSILKKSYAAEPSHKEKAIGILHEMIRCIYKY
ncbi:MAG: hypothetical protein ACRDE2_16685, partial [Chitinophagaceae bacterium]